MAPDRGLFCGGERARGEGAGLPELEQLFEPGENSGEDGHDEGVNGGGQPAMRPQRRSGGRLVAPKG